MSLSTFTKSLSVELNWPGSHSSSSLRHSSRRLQRLRLWTRCLSGSNVDRRATFPPQVRWRQLRRNVLVIDASVLAPVIADAGEDGRRFRERLHGESIAGPDLLRVEVTSVIRRHVHRGQLTPEQADAAVEDLLDFPITVFPTAPLLQRVWDLRRNLTPYDACYVALAEALGAVLVTADQRLANASGPQCRIETP